MSPATTNAFYETREAPGALLARNPKASNFAVFSRFGIAKWRIPAPRLLISLAESRFSANQDPVSTSMVNVPL